ncbi:unnamed protein product [Bursaphelenchus okinawaensis]|uniref:Hexosyltransferase n=1 Tax=Bursaphelenchus okinawaensis TaxID=465554 RepID=A0A811KJY0_9BILA|nr:unnamed protein product [Bursaphelenchus okinawaensis]CAG9104028.1 unnamed protein product [Bursaphelenchus okinawaensis]
MAYGLRTWMPFGLGVFMGLFVAFLLFTSSDLEQDLKVEDVGDIQKFEHWKVQVQKPVSIVVPNQNNQNKVVRSRFAATELGIRDKLILIVLAQSALSVALNASIGEHVPRMQIYADASRIDTDMSVLTNLIPYRLNGLTGQRAHVHILNSIADQALQDNYDWFYFIPETTYVNPFELMRLIKRLTWNKQIALGQPDREGNCILEAGILMSNTAVQSLLQQRHLCQTIVASNDQQAFEMCIRLTTNLACQPKEKDQLHRWWRVEETSETGSAIHDHVHWLASTREFNNTLTVSPLLSEQDALTLHEHFVNVEIGRISTEIKRVSKEVTTFEEELEGDRSWPIGVPGPARPPNRWQVPVWEYFSELDIFKNEPTQNSRPLTGNDALDVREVIEIARKKIEVDLEDGFVDASETFNPDLMEFVQLKHGYRVFNAKRGMEYIVDMEYKWLTSDDKQPLIKRIHVCRPIHFTELLHQVPYVKEDTDITMVIPIQSVEEAEAARSLLIRHIRLCISSSSMIDSRQTRIVLAVRSIPDVTVHQLADELTHLKRKCKSWQTDIALLPLKQQSHAMIEAAALDEAIDHFGQQMIYVLLSPYADYQRELLDRVRINTIRHFQVFFPVPFVEFHPLVVNADRILNLALKEKEKNSVFNNSHMNFDLNNQEALESRMAYLRNLVPPTMVAQRQLVVHKDRGFFDTNDFSVVSLYGTDYINARAKLAQKTDDGETTRLLDLSAIFLGQTDVHMLRSIEPSLRLRYHSRKCSPDLSPADMARCQLSHKQSFGTKSQLANVLFSDLQVMRDIPMASIMQ